MVKTDNVGTIVDFDNFEEYFDIANIALVRREWIMNAVATGQRFGRRQEMEQQIPEALVLAKDVLGKRDHSLPSPNSGGSPSVCFHFPLAACSHPWESMEHPDPCGTQLAEIAKLLEVLPYEAIFYDFSSLYQYGGRSPHHEEVFQMSLIGMHLMYCTGMWPVLRISKVTPWPANSQDEKVLVWTDQRLVHNVPFHPEDKKDLVWRRLGDLKANTTLYDSRGWCAAEMDWMRHGMTGCDPVNLVLGRLWDENFTALEQHGGGAEWREEPRNTIPGGNDGSPPEPMTPEYLERYLETFFREFLASGPPTHCGGSPKG